ncbi:ATP-binding domain-containing protein [Actinoplanes sp. NPDC051851]|uniref:HelD family protein n=1 Tax=Actinoplanes sp. NPDC051851 TaxID=3154753 RepID=UPI00344ACDC1
MSSLSSLAEEQVHLSVLYDRLDGLRERTRARIGELRREHGVNKQALAQRDAATWDYAERLAQYEAVEQGLCFGRLDLADGDRLHIGRIGIHDTEHPLLVDWRAPAARPFYVATAITPHDVTLRRHIRTRDRTVVAIDDEILDLRRAEGGTETLVGEAALIAALTANRTGRMRDIVATIQAEQDRIIRTGLNGVLVVQGGPGTGKTAVALHRAAYLLYTYREQLAPRGVLIVGPNATFLRYISQVLPSLAETGVLLATLGDLFPGVTARRPEPPAVAAFKGRAEMVEVLAAGLRDRQRVPDEPIEIEVDRTVLVLGRVICEPARRRARDSGLLHNAARAIFVAGVLDGLARQLADRIGYDPFWDDPLGEGDVLPSPNVLDEGDVADIRADLAGEPAIRAVLDELWPVLTPQRFLEDFYRDTGHEPLRREPGGGWTPADVPLLDEAAELLGPVGERRDDGETERRIAYAQGILDITAGSKSYELEDDDEAAIPNLADVMEADVLAERLEHRPWRSAASRAAADRQWAFGHVIVDEAQELSPMAVRLLMRRCPSRSMTVVGDLDQTGALGGASSWSEVLGPYVADRWRMVELTVSYRTPAEIMAYAARRLPGIVTPRPVRNSGVEPWEETGTPQRLAELIAAETGRLAVIVPASFRGELAGRDPDAEKVQLTVVEAKGLEFDAVIVVDPDLIVAESPRGENDLYVALTRPTQRLGVFTTCRHHR